MRSCRLASLLLSFWVVGTSGAVVLEPAPPGGGDLFAWTADPEADAYDVVRGRIDGAGDFATMTLECLEDDLLGTGFAFAAPPPPGEVDWFLVRSVVAGNNRSYEHAGPGLAGPRDLGVASSGADCPSENFRFSDAVAAGPTGYACFEIDFACVNPEFVELTRDGVVEEVYLPEAGREHTSRPPESICLSAEDGTDHDYVLRYDCLGETTVAGLRGASAPFDVDIASVATDRPYYTFGQTIVVDLGLAGPLAASATVEGDFSAFDTFFDPSHVTVTNLGGGSFRLEYTPPSAMPLDPGRYPVRLIASAGNATGRERTTRVTFLPSGSPRFGAFQGEFVAAPLTPAVPGGPLQLDGVTLLGEVSAPFPETDFDGVSVPPVGGNWSTDVFERVEVRFTTTLDPSDETFRVEIGEQLRSGHVRHAFEPELVACGPVDCTYRTELWLRNPDPDGPVLDLDFVVAAGTQGAASGQGSIAPSIESGEYTNTVVGNVRREFMHLEPDFGSLLLTAPQYYPVQGNVDVAPAARTLIRIEEPCGKTHYTVTDALGDFHTTFISACPTQSADVVVESFSPGASNVAVFYWLDPPEPMSWQDYTADHQDYATYRYTIGSFTPGDFAPNVEIDAGGDVPDNDRLSAALKLLADARETASYLTEWVAADELLPQFNLLLNYKYYTFADDGKQKPVDSHNRYLNAIHPGLIQIIWKHRWGTFPVPHEFGHYFHEFFVRETEYGRFSEPMANLMGASVAGSPWMILSETSNAESMDVNGAYKNIDGDIALEMAQADPERLTFYADYPDGLAAWQAYDQAGCPEHPYRYCCESGGFQDEMERAECFMLPAPGWQWRIYYDLFDGVVGEPVETFYPRDGSPAITLFGFDQVEGGGDSPQPAGHLIMDVLLNYLGSGQRENPAYVDRGMIKPDLVDLLDGMICRGHMTPAEAGGLLETIMGYDYDYGGPAVCP